MFLFSENRTWHTTMQALCTSPHSTGFSMSQSACLVAWLPLPLVTKSSRAPQSCSPFTGHSIR
eukprot:4799756-Amphidinium_carterae.1